MSCLIKVDQLQAITERYTRTARSVKPIFVVSYGPSGSGKSVVSSQLFAHLRVDEDNVVRVLVDDIITDLGLPTDGNNYRESRDRYADTVRVEIITASLLQKKNVLVEVTGNNTDNIEQWIASARDNGFKTVIFYPFVHDPTLLNRIKAREVASDMENANKGGTSEVTRRVDRNKVHEHTVNAPKNFAKLIKLLHFNEYYLIDNTLTETAGGPNRSFNDKIIFVLKVNFDNRINTALTTGVNFEFFRSFLPEVFSALDAVQQITSLLRTPQNRRVLQTSTSTLSPARSVA
jgi:predicted ABC-type ATPase